MQDENTKDSREGWNIEELAEEGSQINIDEIQRETLRGDETEGDADDRDNAGSAHRNETWQGREEAKNDRGGKANVNG